MGIQPIRIVIQGIDQLSSTIAQSQKKIEKFGKGMEQVGKTMTIGLTLPIVAFGASTLQTAANFEASMNRVQVLSRATGDQMEAMSKQARDLGASTKFSASEAGDAMGFLAMAGFSAEKIMGAMPGTLALAAASGMDLARTADIASNVLTGFNLQAEDMNRVADVMAYTMSASNVNVEMLGESMKFVAPIAAGMNVKIEEVSAALGFLGNAGIQGAMGGTALRQMFATLAKPTNETARALARLKIPKSELIDATGNVKGIIPVIAALERQGATAADVIEIFGTKVGPAMQALLKQGAGPLRKFTEELEKSGGTAQKIADVQTKGLAGQLKNLKSAFEALQLAIADSGLLELATDLVTVMKDYLIRLSQISPDTLRTIAVFGMMVASIGPILLVLGSFIGALANVNKFLGLFNTSIIGVSKSLTGLMLNPIFLIVAAIAVWVYVLYLLIKNWDDLMDAFSSKFMFLKTIKFFFADIANSIADILALIPGLGKLSDFFRLSGKGFELEAQEIAQKEYESKIKIKPEVAKKIGFSTEADAGKTLDVQNLVGRMGVINQNENVTKITIEDRAGVKLRAETEKGTLDTEVMRGLGFQGAY